MKSQRRKGKDSVRIVRHNTTVKVLKRFKGSQVIVQHDEFPHPLTRHHRDGVVIIERWVTSEPVIVDNETGERATDSKGNLKFQTVEHQIVANIEG